MGLNLLQQELDNIEYEARARRENLMAAKGRIAECEILTQRLRGASDSRFCIMPFVCPHTHGVPAMIRVDVFRASCEDVFGALVIAGLRVVNVHHEPQDYAGQARALSLLCDEFEVPIWLIDYIGNPDIFSPAEQAAPVAREIPAFLRRQAA